MQLISCSNSTKFELLPHEVTGIDFNNLITENDTFHILNSEYIYNGGGVGVGDLDNDGDPDLVFVGNMVPVSVYSNNGEFNFSNVTNDFEGLSNNQWFSGVSIADINGDGWKDVYITSTMDENPEKRKNRLWINKGVTEDSFPTFQERSEEYGVADTGFSEHAGFFDYDLDGDLDLYILNNSVDKVTTTGYRQRITDGSSANNDKLYQNNGNGTFSDVTVSSGITYEGFGLGLAFSDLNKDGYPDIYISNDYVANDVLYINQQDGTFKNESPMYLSYQSKFSMGNDISDINNDGFSDIMSTDMMPEQYAKKKQTINGNSYSFYINDEKYGFEHQHLRNMLHLHNGFANGKMLPFSEVGQMLGIYQTEWSWSPLFADFDNDGDRDLIVTNGYPKDLTDKDFIKYKARVYQYIATDQQVMSRVPQVKVHNYAFEQNDAYTFTDKSEVWGMDATSFSYGASFVDLDLDGDLDYVTNNINDFAFVYRNNSEKEEGNNYILLSLEGAGNNTQGIGAKVEIWSNGQYQYYEHFLSRGYLSSVDPTVHFGLGKEDNIDSIKVRWPSGQFSKITSPTINQRLTVNEAESQAPRLQPDPPPTIFQRREAILTYSHEQTDYNDFFQSQTIIPHKFSQVGPFIAEGDLNQDGKNDLIVGSTDLLPTRVFLQSENGYEPAEVEGLTTLKKCTETGLLLIDIDGDKDLDVITISGGYANEDPSDYKHFLYKNEGGTFIQQELRLPAFPASTLIGNDYDHDGDVDIFIGARVTKGNFPLVENSFLLFNEEGSLTIAKQFNAGMVTGALWTDYNKDNWKDLIIAQEWGSPIVLDNKEGNLEITMSPSMNKKKGLWTSIASGDFDQDGDEDIILGNLGQNHRFLASDKYPMTLYSVDLDQNGVVDPLSTAYWKDAYGNMQEYPINYMDELAAQSPYFRKIFTGYADFSYASTERIFDVENIPEAAKNKVNTTSSYVLWNNEGAFVWEELPKKAQVSPIKQMLVYDFTGDSYPDVLVGGNDHSYDVSTGHYNANKGQLMISKGAGGGFEVLGPAETGLLLEGQVESLFLTKGERPLIIVGINRKDILVYEYIPN